MLAVRTGLWLVGSTSTCATLSDFSGRQRDVWSGMGKSLVSEQTAPDGGQEEQRDNASTVGGSGERVLGWPADHYGRGRGATVVGIYCDSFAAHKAFAEQEGLEIPLLADMHREVCRAYGLYWADLNVASRGTVIVGPDRVVRWVEAREPGNAFTLDTVLGGIG